MISFQSFHIINPLSHHCSIPAKEKLLEAIAGLEPAADCLQDSCSFIRLS